MFGPGSDEPLVWCEGSGTSTRRYYHADERGSVIAISDSSGAMYAINSYDEYGIPASSNTGRFQYTGQAWLPELGMSYYRNRIYSATLGRFLQTDPIGFGGGMNIYAYVRNDPANLLDPSGLEPQTCAHWAQRLRWADDLSDSPSDSTIWEWRQLCWKIDDLPTLIFDPLTCFNLSDAVDQFLGDLHDLACTVGAVGAGGGGELFPGFGGGVFGGASFDPRTGQLSVFGSGYVGGGFGGGTYLMGMVNAPSGISANLAAGGGVTGAVGVSGARNLIGSNPGENSFAAIKAGPDLSVSATVGAVVSLPVSPRL